jgi:hypothetical protein
MNLILKLSKSFMLSKTISLCWFLKINFSYVFYFLSLLSIISFSFKFKIAASTKNKSFFLIFYSFFLFTGSKFNKIFQSKLMIGKLKANSRW